LTRPKVQTARNRNDGNFSVPRNLSFAFHLSNIARVKKDGFLRHASIAFGIAVVFYIVFFTWMQHRREGRGPWEVTFVTDANGAPSIAIQQPKLNVSHRIFFDGTNSPQKDLSQTVEFVQGTTQIPFGEMLFQDPTFLPGTVTMKLFGHVVELLPRVLIVDQKEHPWSEPDLHLPLK
jgi:hypothetical protein